MMLIDYRSGNKRPPLSDPLGSEMLSSTGPSTFRAWSVGHNESNDGGKGKWDNAADYSDDIVLDFERQGTR